MAMIFASKYCYFMNCHCIFTYKHLLTCYKTMIYCSMYLFDSMEDLYVYGIEQ